MWVVFTFFTQRDYFSVFSVSFVQYHNLTVSQSLCPKPKKPDSYPCPCLAAQARNGLLPPSSVYNCLMTLEMPLQWPINISSSQQPQEKEKVFIHKADVKTKGFSHSELCIWLLVSSSRETCRLFCRRRILFKRIFYQYNVLAVHIVL